MPTAPDILRDTNFYVMPPGRRIFAFEQVAAAATARALPELAERATSAAAHDRRLLDQQARYRRSGASLHGSRARELDAVIDRATASVDGYLLTQINLFGDEHPRGRAADQVRVALFPNGVAAITSQSYVQEHVEIENLLARAAAPELAEARAALPDLEPMLVRLAELNRAYGDALVDEDGLPSADELREQNTQGQRHIAELAMFIYVHFLRQVPTDGDGLAALLEPIYRQNEAVRQARRRRRNALRDIDPDTGEEQPAPPAEGDDDNDAGDDLPDDGGETGDDTPDEGDGAAGDDTPNSAAAGAA